MTDTRMKALALAALSKGLYADWADHLQEYIVCTVEEVPEFEAAVERNGFEPIRGDTPIDALSAAAVALGLEPDLTLMGQSPTQGLGEAIRKAIAYVYDMDCESEVGGCGSESFADMVLERLETTINEPTQATVFEEAYAYRPNVKYIDWLGSSDMRKVFLERFPTGDTSTRDLLTWLSEDPNGPAYYFNGFLGVCNVDSEVHDFVEQGVRNVFKTLALKEATPPSLSNPQTPSASPE